jgi:hypothetical protein
MAEGGKGGDAMTTPTPAMTAHEYLAAIIDKVFEDARKKYRLVNDLIDLAERWDWEDMCAMGEARHG